ncbi:MAG: AraC family transcriptional regulator [Clostridia bacterium]|nr:AraC family transcriptional regulator [Clostridia bacterium]
MKSFHVFAGAIDVERTKIENVSADNTPHCHDRYEILYIIEGKGTCSIEGVEYPISPRCIFVLPPFSYHTLRLEAESTLEYASVLFEEQCALPTVKEMLDAFGLADGNMSPAVFYSANSISDQIAAVVERFEIADSFAEEIRVKFMMLLISELILLVSTAARVRSVRGDSAIGVRVIRYLNENINVDVNLDALAKRFFVSKYHLCRAFKKHNGISVHGYVNQKRILYAKQLIEAGETASRAAYQVGFGDYSAFYRAYVKVMGKAPTSIDEAH